MTKFKASERLEAVLAVEAGESEERVARQFGMSRQVVNASVRLYGEQGLERKKRGRRLKSPKPKRELTQLEQLLAENEYLRAENEYLKKLNALVAEREAREKHDKGTE